MGLKGSFWPPWAFTGELTGSGSLYNGTSVGTNWVVDVA